MSKEKQILQLRLDGFSQRRIADTLKVSRNTVARVVKACDAHPINEQELQAIDESKLHQHLFPEETRPAMPTRLMSRSFRPLTNQNCISISFRKKQGLRCPPD
ncbi:helix-turn-helix domain-containing protein [Acetobacterium sp. KB-1]|uniref:helix-turn-helix domain-containing protein n=1 Tax=Acetobacterium sp. KB-1 TaxID=2184575 RepID=UPI0013A69509|nr:helix-turn-helix domain-containing protein [Acetobacterium sp. KB-1]